MPNVQAQLYAKAWLSLLNKEADLNSDTLKVTLHSSSHTLGINTHQYVSDLTDELSTAGGYTAGGATVTGSFALTVANSWASTHATATAVPLGAVRRPSTGNGYLYRAVVAGTTGGTAPTWPTVVGTTVIDGGVTWLCIGTAVVVLDLGDTTLWAAPFTAGPWRYLVVSDRTPGSASTQPLVCVFDFGTDQTGGGGAYDLATPVEGILTIPVG
ncbi:hypothetical protein [Actinoplanes sp. NPDC049599]|uniref:hypothetical protein n=1 Tax=Actinoplanes sp. NPDC049599 TaxID=3363903 RepID=UPI0037A413BD